MTGRFLTSLIPTLAFPSPFTRLSCLAKPPATFPILVPGFGRGCDAVVKFFQIASPNTSGGHDLGKFTLRFFRGRIHGDFEIVKDNTLFLKPNKYFPVHSWKSDRLFVHS